MTPAEEIRQAAQTLRQLLSHVSTPGPWSGTQAGTILHWEEETSCVLFGDVEDAGDAAYVASMDPVVGSALADWLDTAHEYLVQRVWEPGSLYGQHALAIARAIHGSGQ